MPPSKRAASQPTSHEIYRRPTDVCHAKRFHGRGIPLVNFTLFTRNVLLSRDTVSFNKRTPQFHLSCLRYVCAFKMVKCSIIHETAPPQWKAFLATTRIDGWLAFRSAASRLVTDLRAICRKSWLRYLSVTPRPRSRHLFSSLVQRPEHASRSS